jgi:hypothetical protein
VEEDALEIVGEMVGRQCTSAASDAVIATGYEEEAVAVGDDRDWGVGSRPG